MSDYIFDSRYRIARKEHECSLCGDPIKKGERYFYQAHKWNGEMISLYIHPDCENFADKYLDFPSGEIDREEFREGVAEAIDNFEELADEGLLIPEIIRRFLIKCRS